MATLDAMDLLIPSDRPGWVSGSWEGSMQITTRSGPEEPAITEALARHVSLGDHPMAVAMKSGVTGAIRMSDLVDPAEWRHHAVFEDLYRLMGTTEQLTIPVHWEGSEFSALVLNRADRDFADEEAALASSIMPLLFALVATAGKDLSPTSTEDEHRLTSREAEILNLVALGMTAGQIASLSRISPRTVAKHLEHIYTKLGVTNRIDALRVASGQRAREY